MDDGTAKRSMWPTSPGSVVSTGWGASIAQLLEHGLLRPSLAPPPEIRRLRMLTRCRGALAVIGETHLRSIRVEYLTWTVADLAGRDVPGRDDLAVALAMRRGEQPGAVKQEAVRP
jgi:hypothetical protein